MDGDCPVLPQDIITNILIRLPVKFLIRFQCVCKHWKNLLKTPSFIAEHLHYSSHQNPCLLLGDYDKSDSFRICLLDREMQVLELRNDAFVDPIRRPSILGSCNGLICLRLSTYPISLCILVWNPAIREARVTGALSYSENNDYGVGFGFSPTANDYKIVNIRVCLIGEVEVLTLSTGVMEGS
ncbi:putative F-box protein At3g16210 [Prosopis cineraria]|uniref:putative F-box protein At3g16210 n=1 Tax=Prosopis cineraria TaxID=364024 RepID=UPI00240FCB3C|nr:putative F-box protein At3g16210 [Prosopis cineraria]